MLWEQDCWGRVSADFGSGRGVYCLRNLDSAAMIYYPVQPFSGPDTEGILYVERPEAVWRRIGDLRQVVCAAEKDGGYRSPANTKWGTTTRARRCRHDNG